MRAKVGSWILDNIIGIVTLATVVFYAGSTYRQIQDHEQRISVNEKSVRGMQINWSKSDWTPN